MATPAVGGGNSRPRRQLLTISSPRNELNASTFCNDGGNRVLATTLDDDDDWVVSDCGGSGGGGGGWAEVVVVPFEFCTELGTGVEAGV